MGPSRRTRHRVLDPILDLLFPVDCVLCERRASGWRRGPLCAACETASLAGPASPVCERCGLAGVAAGGMCAACLTGRTRYDFGRAALAFNDAVRLLVHEFKYNDRVSLARPLGRRLKACLERHAFGSDCAVPVPLHPRRQRRRGYNQAELLAARLGLPVERGVVRRRRDTGSQTGMTRAQRVVNVQGAFECRERVERSVVVVDDIQTTGATLNELTRVLKRHGARRVEVLTLARVGGDSKSA